MRTLAADRVTAALAAVSIAMAALPAALALAHAGSRPAWLALIVAELAWGFGGGLTGTVLAANRKSRLPGAPPRLKPSLWLIDEGIRGDLDVVLRPAGGC